jgi:hypothetical protein
MKIRVWHLARVFVGAIVLFGCGSADETADPFRDVVGNKGLLHFQVDAEKPLAQGPNDLMISIFETSTHSGFVGAQVELSATMPAMAHATPTTVTVEEREGGKYIARSLSLPMAGRWVVELQASRQEIIDTAQLTYDLR